MSSIHYFQRYSHPENVATNNTMLLLSRLYQDAPNKFNGFLNELLDDNDLAAGVIFKQQQKGKGSIPDGSLSQVSFKVLVETKLHKNFSLHQLTEHLNGFGTEQYQVLLSLSPTQPDKSLKSQIETAVSIYNDQHKTSVKYLPTTFQEIVTKFNNSLEDHDYELIEIINDFEAYCIQDKLITNIEEKMRVVPCGWTLQENFKFNIYYDPADRGYSDHNFLGIYADKAIRGIGKVENIITANLLPSGNLQIIESNSAVTPQQEQNIIGVIAAAKAINNWDIATGHKFFSVEQFYPTNYRKTSKYPLQGSKFFNLKELLQLTNLPSTQEIARILNHLEW